MIVYTERILSATQIIVHGKLELDISFVNNEIAQTVLVDWLYDKMYFKRSLGWRPISE